MWASSGYGMFHIYWMAMALILDPLFIRFDIIGLRCGWFAIRLRILILRKDIVLGEVKGGGSVCRSK